MSLSSKRLLQNLLLSITVFVICILVLEVTFRTTHLFGARLAYAMPDSVLAYRFRPGAEYYYHEENPTPVTGRFNNFGWRDRDWTIDKPDSVVRVAVLGDSFVEAFQVESDSTFVSIAGRMLRTRFDGTAIEMMNFGRSGFAQTEEWWLLQHEVARFSPDIVVVCFLPFNDIEDVRRKTAPDDERPFYLVSEDGDLTLDTRFRNDRHYQTKLLVEPFKRHSAVLSFLAERYSMYKLRHDIEEHAKEVASRATTLTGYLSLCTSRPDSDYAASYRFSKMLLSRMAEFCHQHGMELLLVCLDNEAYRPRREQEILRIDSTFNPYFFEDDLAHLASALDIHYLGMQRIFRKTYVARNRPLHWKHLNYEGHRVTAGALTAALGAILETNTGNHLPAGGEESSGNATQTGM